MHIRHPKCRVLLVLFYLCTSFIMVGSTEKMQSTWPDFAQLSSCERNSTMLSCPGAVVDDLLPVLPKLSWLETLTLEESNVQLSLPWEHFVRSPSINTVDFSKVKLSCSCSNMWLAFWDTILKPVAPTESLVFEKDVLLWFLADVSRVCRNDCPKTVRDVYDLPQSVILPNRPWQHCLKINETHQAVDERQFFTESCGLGSLNFSVDQVIFSHNKRNDVVTCTVMNDTVPENGKSQCPKIKITTFLQEPLKPDYFTWCMFNHTTVLSVNNVKPNSSGWIICYGHGFLPQAAAIPLLVITLPVFTRFESTRANTRELHIKFQLHSYPHVDLRLFIWEGEKKGWREVDLDDEYVSQKGRRGAVWFSRALRALASTTTEGEIQFTDMDTVCRTDRYNFTACNTVGCAWETFVLKPDEENVLCAANADSPASLNKPMRKTMLSFTSTAASGDALSNNFSDVIVAKSMEIGTHGTMTVVIPFLIVAVLLVITMTTFLYLQYKKARRRPVATSATRNADDHGAVQLSSKKPMLAVEADACL